MPVPGEVLAALEREASRTLSLWRRLTGPQLFAASFFLLIAFGTALLLFLPGLYTGPRLSLIDSLFMATSAVCVTGLAVVDLATYFTTWGQVVYLLLIQIGGIGILTVTTVLILWLGGRLRLRSESALGMIESGPAIDTRQLFRAILRYAFVIEAIGAIILWLAWARHLGPSAAVWPAIFHAVSAFCNAGVSNLAGDLVPYRDDPLILGVVMVLVVLGGIGFLVLEEVLRVRRTSKNRRLSLHSRLVLVTTAILIAGGWALFALFEWNYALGPDPWYQRIVQALFLSISPRTAGFVTLDYSALSSASLSLTIILMMIGGSPGSVAGGLKTTTIAVLVALANARVRGEVVTHAFRRTIPEPTIQRAIGLVVLVIAFLAAAILVLQSIEFRGVAHHESGNAFMQVVVEAVGAFNTVGLSLGLTPLMSSAGKIILAILMYIGRVGPLTLAASMMIAARKIRPQIRYSSEDVIIG